MAIDKGSVPAAGETDPRRLADAIRQIYQNAASQSSIDAIASAAVQAVDSGFLAFSSTTALTFTPLNGDRIKISGTMYAIPAAGIAGLANTSVFVAGVAAQNLAASTLYYVYAFINSATVTADFSTTAHATSATAGNVGTEIKSGDDTRTLIGMVRTNGSSQFVDAATQRFVRSWFNRQHEVTRVSNAFTAQRSTTTTSTSGAELNSEIRVEFLTWAKDTFIAGLSGYAFNATPDYAFMGVGWDGVITSSNHFAIAYGNNGSGMAVTEMKSGLSEGYHYATVMAYVPSGTGSFGRVGGPYCILNGCVR